MSDWTRLTSAGDITKGEAKVFQVGEKILALFHLEDGSWVALDDRCPHRGGPLSEGTFTGQEVTCPWHQARFELKSGKCLSGPAVKGVVHYPLQVVDEEIQIKL